MTAQYPQTWYKVTQNPPDTIITPLKVVVRHADNLVEVDYKGASMLIPTEHPDYYLFRSFEEMGWVLRGLVYVNEKAGK